MVIEGVHALGQARLPGGGVTANRGAGDAGFMARHADAAVDRFTIDGRHRRVDLGRASIGRSGVVATCFVASRIGGGSVLTCCCFTGSGAVIRCCLFGRGRLAGACVA